MTKIQREFLKSILPEDPTDCSWFPAEPYERRTAISLYKKGLIEFINGEIPKKGECFECRFSVSGPHCSSKSMEAIQEPSGSDHDTKNNESTVQAL